MSDPFTNTFIISLLSLLFVGAALHKALNLRDFQAIITAYDILPLSAVPFGTFSILSCEILTVVLLIVFPPAGIVASSLMFLFYGVLIAFNILRGNRHIDCGCSWGRKKTGNPDHLKWRHVYRNLFLILFACGGLIPDTGRALTWVDHMNVFLSLVTAFVFYLTASTLSRIWSRMKEHAHV